MEELYVLGASDPEMTAVERVLRAAGKHVEYATVVRGAERRRVRPAEAYAPDVEVGEGLRGLGAHVYCIECRPAVLFGSAVEGIDWAGLVTVIDHHREGDPGFGRPPAEYWTASSLGQVLSHLGVGVEYSTREAACRVLSPQEGMSANHIEARYCEGPGLHLVASGKRGLMALRPLPPAFMNAVAEFLLPEEALLVAAADHCLGAAYRGSCEGVFPDTLMHWRAASRAGFQGRSVESLLDDVAAATAALKAAAPLYLGHGVEPVADMRRPQPVPELPEAAVRLGVGYVSGPLVGPDGKYKYTCSGSPVQVRAFLEHWAPEAGLVGLYGDPARGFAGGYASAATSDGEAEVVGE